MKCRFKFCAVTVNTVILWYDTPCTKVVSDFSEISTAYIYRVEEILLQR